MPRQSRFLHCSYAFSAWVKFHLTHCFKTVKIDKFLCFEFGKKGFENVNERLCIKATSAMPFLAHHLSAWQMFLFRARLS